MSTTISFYNHFLSHQSPVISIWIKISLIWFDWLRTQVAWPGWRCKTILSHQEPLCFPRVTNFNEAKNECWKRLPKQLMKHTVRDSDLLDRAVLPLWLLTETTIKRLPSTVEIIWQIPLAHITIITLARHRIFTSKKLFHLNSGSPLFDSGN